MVEKYIKRVVAFDFDDTLAITDSSIGVRLKAGGPIHELVKSKGIHSRKTEDGWDWLDSENYEKLQSLFPSTFNCFEFDYTQTMSVNLETVQPINHIIELLRESLDDPETLTIILTARSGHSTIWSPSRKCEVESRNKQCIANFLNTQGIIIPIEHIHTVGDIGNLGGDTAVAKADVLEGYANEYSLSEVVLYDDSRRNIEEALKLPRRPSFNCEIVIKEVRSGKITRTIRQNRKIGIKERFLRIFNRIPE
jgi:hypothetical protein